eukprot:3272267-Karenia_brevis.AAC.1
MQARTAKMRCMRMCRAALLCRRGIVHSRVVIFVPLRAKIRTPMNSVTSTIYGATYISGTI